MTITAEPTEERDIQRIPSDPWAAVWAPPANGDVNDRHESARRHQQVGSIPSQGNSHRAGQASLPPKSSPVEPEPPRLVVDNPTPGTEEQHPRRRRLRAVRIAIATTAIGLAAAAVGAAAWYFGVFGG